MKRLVCLLLCLCFLAACNVKKFNTTESLEPTTDRPLVQVTPEIAMPLPGNWQVVPMEKAMQSKLASVADGKKSILQAVYTGSQSGELAVPLLFAISIPDETFLNLKESEVDAVIEEAFNGDMLLKRVRHAHAIDARSIDMGQKAMFYEVTMINANRNLKSFMLGVFTQKGLTLFMSMSLLTDDVAMEDLRYALNNIEVDGDVRY